MGLVFSAREADTLIGILEEYLTESLYTKERSRTTIKMMLMYRRTRLIEIHNMTIVVRTIIVSWFGGASCGAMDAVYSLQNFIIRLIVSG